MDSADERDGGVASREVGLGDEEVKEEGRRRRRKLICAALRRQVRQACDQADGGFVFNHGLGAAASVSGRRLLCLKVAARLRSWKCMVMVRSV